MLVLSMWEIERYRREVACSSMMSNNTAHQAIVYPHEVLNVVPHTQDKVHRITKYIEYFGQ
jgi:hypothetical protein